MYASLSLIIDTLNVLLLNKKTKKKHLYGGSGFHNNIFENKG